MNIGNAIKIIRTKKKMTQAELCTMCGISQTSMSQIENGYKKPKNATIKKICHGLDVSESLVYILAMQTTDIPPNKKRDRGYTMACDTSSCTTIDLWRNR